MPAREMRMEMFLRALMRGDYSKAKAHLDKLEKIVGDDEWGRGYSKAINGFLSALSDNDTDALIVQLIRNPDNEKAKKLLEHFENILQHEFRDDYEKGYYTAWKELLTAYLSQERLGVNHEKK
ncbi:MAG: hypothetical protein PWP49_1483 [Thermococcaceae archaeon]|jgi:hypothetical protein|uniref:hypothetical protein n=1 Tax=Thermococcus TaxID=2263 RepID=UPI00074A142D|nr:MULTISPECIES: hypothetical protein [Thermococcus]KUJ99292.1 MAG: Uncharacterized protein XD43_1043 [Thermococcales archaeon 44_46]MDK2854533.1 hypothetical protein [Thermococcaceae archaeon]MCA6214579.1 hypothetical protein [Thermococcus bergensis]MDN5321063.1 hypothetical protein [Thermococcaceae archaeon]MPW38592.1 hypothetical protein [Thermococcus sp. 101 C5]